MHTITWTTLATVQTHMPSYTVLHSIKIYGNISKYFKIMLPACWLITLLPGGGKSKLSTAMSPPAGQSENHFTAMDLNLNLNFT